MKASEIRQMSNEELGTKLDDLQRNLFALRCQAVTEKLEDCNAIQNTKKDIARIKTVLREKQ